MAIIGLHKAIAGWMICLSLVQSIPLPAPTKPTSPEPVQIESQYQMTVAGQPKLNRRVYDLPNGDQVLMGRLETSQPGEASTQVEQLTMEGTGGQYRYYDSLKQSWIRGAMEEGTIQAGMVWLSTGQEAYLIYTPKTYRTLQNESLQYLPNNDGTVHLAQENTEWKVTITAKAASKGVYADYTVVRSNEQLIDWDYPQTEDLWKNYTLDGDGKWCYDGYYWPSPSTYVPSGQQVYYRCMASYLVKSFAYAAPAHRAAEDLAVCMLDTLIGEQTEQGYWPTLSESTWLSGDYAIGAGFYDTRFNTDLVQIMAYTYERQGGEGLKASMNAYADFYLRFAQDHHSTTKQGGWLVDDYWHPSGGNVTHTSLNHQVAECELLFQLSDLLERPQLATTAQLLLQGITDTGSRWIRPDGNLHYAVYPGGRYGGQDYPYLTYNDLFSLQKLLQARGMEPNAVLEQLMASKKLWMDAQGIQGYRTS